MWLTASYESVALFTLKSGLATSTGAKTLLVPTPFAIRTALLDVAIRVDGVAQGPEAFDLLRELDIALRPSSYAVVTNLFAKIQKPSRSDKEREEAMTPTIAFREYVHLQGPFMLAFSGETAAVTQLDKWLPHLTYLGRRGGFVQFLPTEHPIMEELPDSFTSLMQPLPESSFPLGVLQTMDDWGPELTYEKVNVYSDESIKRPGATRERLRYGVVFPYELRQAGRGFTMYERFSI